MSGEGPNEQEGLSQEDIDAALNAAGAGGASGDAPSPADEATEEGATTSGAISDGATGDGATGDGAVSGEAADDGLTGEEAADDGVTGDAAVAGVPSEDEAGESPPSGDASDGDVLAGGGGGEEAQSEPPSPQAETDGALAEASDASAEVAGSSEEEAAIVDDSAFGGLKQADIDAALAGATTGPTLETTNPDGTPKLDSTGKPFDEAAAMMEAAIAEEKAAAAAADAAAASEPHVAQAPIHKEAAVPPPLPPGATPLELQDFDSALADPEGKGIELLNDVELNVKIELGRAQMLIEDVLKLGEGAVVELDKLAGDPVDVLVNERLVARGEVLVLNDSFCVRISEIVAGVGLAEEA